MIACAILTVAGGMAASAQMGMGMHAGPPQPFNPIMMGQPPQMPPQ